MKSFVAKAVLFMLPLVAFSTESLAGQAIVVATSQQEQHMTSHDTNHAKQDAQNHRKACCQHATSAHSDDESIAAKFSTKSLKKLYEE